MAEKNQLVENESAVSFSAALRFWIKLGFINFGGPAGQIAIMHRELVERRRWISEERFLHALNFCMLLPGPEAQQLAIYIGWAKHGVRGALAAGIFFILPGTVLITTIAFVYAKFHSLPAIEGILFGLKAAVLAIVTEALFRIAKRALKRRIHWLVASTAFIALFAFAVPFPLVILAAGVFGVFRPGAEMSEPSADVVTSRATPYFALKALLICGALWIAPVLLIVLALGTTHVLSQEALFFSKMAMVTFGGAYAALSYVAQEAVVRFGWLNADDMLQGLALAETTPGPLILVLTFVGFLGAYTDSAPFTPMIAGLLGALVTTWVTFVPCFLWILVGAPYLEQLRRQPKVSSALAMVTAAVVGVILNLSLWFALHVLFRQVELWKGFGFTLWVPKLISLDGWAVALAAGAMVALWRFKLPMTILLPLCALAGFIIKSV